MDRKIPDLGTDSVAEFEVGSAYLELDFVLVLVLVREHQHHLHLSLLVVPAEYQKDYGSHQIVKEQVAQPVHDLKREILVLPHWHEMRKT